VVTATDQAANQATVQRNIIKGTTAGSVANTKIYLSSGDNFTVSNSGITLFGNTGNNEATIASGVTGVILDQNFERVNFTDLLSGYAFKQTGNMINVYNSAGTTLIVTIPVQGDGNGTLLAFNNGTATASALLAGGVMTLGGQTVSASSATTLDITTSYSTPSATTSANAKVFLAADDTFTVRNSGTTIYGSTGNNVVTMAADVIGGVTGVILDQNIERINFPAASGNYAFKQSGNMIIVYAASGTTPLVSAPVQGDSDGTVLGFNNGTASAKLTGGVMTLGGVPVSSGTQSTLPGLIPTP
jgi:hypothetical protein